MYDLELSNWVYTSVRVPYLSIYNFDNLKLNVNEFGNSMNKNTPEIKEKYLKLETRLRHFMDSLIENTNNQKINMNILKYLKFLIHERVFIPHKFLSYFELCRLNIKNGQIK